MSPSQSDVVLEQQRFLLSWLPRSLQSWQSSWPWSWSRGSPGGCPGGRSVVSRVWRGVAAMAGVVSMWWVGKGRKGVVGGC